MNGAARRWARLAAPLAIALALPAGASSQVDARTDTLTLGTAVERAVARGPETAAARAGVDAADAARRQARAAWLPSLSGSGALTRFEEPMVVAPLHGLDPSHPPDFDRTLTQGRLTAGWTLFDGGVRRARTGAAGARADGARAAEADAEARLVAEVTEAWLRVLTARDAVASRAARERDLEAERERALRFVAEGTAPRLEALRAEAELARVRADGVGARAERVAAEIELARLVGTDADAVARLALPDVRWAGPAAGAALTEAAGQTAAHPVVQQARARAAAAHALVREARAQWWPRIQGTGGVVEYGSGSGASSREWQAGLQLDLALFTGGARRARVQEVAAEARRADAEADAVADAVARSGERAAAALEEAQARADALATAVTRFEELTRVEALALEEGAGVQADYLRARAALEETQVGLADARRAVVRAAVGLARAQGRLDRSWIATHLEEDR